MTAGMRALCRSYIPETASIGVEAHVSHECGSRSARCAQAALRLRLWLEFRLGFRLQVRLWLGLLEFGCGCGSERVVRQQHANVFRHIGQIHNIMLSAFRTPILPDLQDQFLWRGYPAHQLREPIRLIHCLVTRPVDRDAIYIHAKEDFLGCALDVSLLQHRLRVSRCKYENAQ